MLRSLMILSSLLVLVNCGSLPDAYTPAEPITNEPKLIVFDTDFDGDADDLGAIAMLHKYADMGIIEILAINSWSNERYAVPAIDAVNHFYGRPDLTIGVRDSGIWETEWNYSKAIADRFPHSIKSSTEVAKSTEVYRRILADAKDNSVTIVTVGPLANIKDLLASPPDSISTLTGKTLVNRKVKEFVIMGGFIPNLATSDKPEWNFDGNMKGVTRYVLDNIDVPIVFSGYSIGQALPSGKELNNHPQNTPLYVGYKYFSEHAPWINHQYAGDILDNPTYDQTAVMYASIGGLGVHWILSEPGKVTVNDVGLDRWEYSEEGNHRFLILPNETDKLRTTRRTIIDTMMHNR